MILDEDNNDEKLIINFLTGELSQQEIIFFHERMEKDQAFRKSFEETVRIWEASLFTSANLNANQDTDQRLNAFLDKTVRAEVRLKPKIGKLIYWTTGVAASILFGILVYTNNFTNRKTEVATFGNKMLGYVLPDSSVVDINKDSKLSYSSKFGGSKREVFLSGEAFFSIIKNTERPFIVHVNDAEIKVVGTSFNVKTVNDKIEVSVKTGEVLIYFSNYPENKKLLLHNEKGTIDLKNKIITKETTSANYSVWKNGAFTFNKTSLTEVLRELGDYFGVKIVCNDQKLNSVPITATFSNLTLEQILDILSYSDEMRFTKKEDVILVEKERSNEMN